MVFIVALFIDRRGDISSGVGANRTLRGSTEGRRGYLAGVWIVVSLGEALGSSGPRFLCRSERSLWAVFVVVVLRLSPQGRFDGGLCLGRSFRQINGSQYFGRLRNSLNSETRTRPSSNPRNRPRLFCDLDASVARSYLRWYAEPNTLYLLGPPWTNGVLGNRQHRVDGSDSGIDGRGIVLDLLRCGTLREFGEGWALI